jgi:hypothetical protein
VKEDGCVEELDEDGDQVRVAVIVVAVTTVVAIVVDAKLINYVSFFTIYVVDANNMPPHIVSMTTSNGDHILNIAQLVPSYTP